MCVCVFVQSADVRFAVPQLISAARNEHGLVRSAQTAQAVIHIHIYIYIYTLAVKKNCSLVVQIVTWFAAVRTILSQSSPGSGSRDNLAMFNLHLFIIFWCSRRAI